MEDWNAAVMAGACIGPQVCAMPLCPLPLIHVQTVNMALCGFKMSGHPDALEASVLWATASRDEHGVDDDGTDYRRTYDYETTSNYDPAAAPICQRGHLAGTYVDASTGWATSARLVLTTDETTTLTLDGLSDGDNLVTGAEVNVFTDYTAIPPDTTTTTGTNTAPFPDLFSLASIQTWSGASLVLSGTNGTYTVTGSIDYTDAYTPEAAAAAISTAELIDPEWEDSASNVIVSAAVTMASDDTRITAAGGVRGRYRLEVPGDYTGSYYKWTWDTVFFPEDDSAPTVLESRLTDTWSGPGSPGSPDTYATPWRDSPSMPSPGEVRIVNASFSCRRTAWGWKPQTIGEAVDV